MDEGRAGCFVLTLRSNLVSKCSVATGALSAEVPKPVLGVRAVLNPKHLLLGEPRASPLCMPVSHLARACRERHSGD